MIYHNIIGHPYYHNLVTGATQWEALTFIWLVFFLLNWAVYVGLLCVILIIRG